MSAPRFRARIQPVRGGGQYVIVPPVVVRAASLRHGERVRGSVDGGVYRSSLMKYSGVFHLGVHKAILEAVGRKIGDTVTVTIRRDTAPLPGEAEPADLRAALRRDPALRAAWRALAPSRRREEVRHLEGAKRPETRSRRLERLLGLLRNRGS